MLPAIFGDATVMATGANFIQRIVREANYHLSPSEKLIARDIYKGLAKEILSQGNWNNVDLEKLETALDEHLELRVATIKPKPKKLKYKIKSWLSYPI